MDSNNGNNNLHIPTTDKTHQETSVFARYVILR